MESSYPVVVHIHALIWAEEITWNLDGGSSFGPYADNSDNYEELTLSGGDHVLYYLDAYGDGWHGGYWELQDGCSTPQAGGEAAGQVEGSGGEFQFSLPFANSNCRMASRRIGPSGDV